MRIFRTTGNDVLMIHYQKGDTTMQQREKRFVYRSKDNIVALWSVIYLQTKSVVCICLLLCANGIVWVFKPHLNSNIVIFCFSCLAILAIVAIIAWLFCYRHRQFLTDTVCIQRQWPGLPMQPRIIAQKQKPGSTLNCREAVMSFSAENFTENVLRQLPPGRYLTITHEALKDAIWQCFPEHFSAKPLGKISLAHSRKALLRHECPRNSEDAAAEECVGCPVAANAYGGTSPMDSRVRFAAL